MTKRLIRTGRKLVAFLLFIARKLCFEKIPPIPVVSVLVEKKGKILGIIRSDGLGISLPSGVINWNEDIKTAAIRETLQETGLKVKLTNLFGIYSRPKKGIGFNTINVVYLGQVQSGTLKKSIEGKPCWFNHRQMLASKTEASKILKDYLEKHKIS